MKNRIIAVAPFLKRRNESDSFYDCGLLSRHRIRFLGFLKQLLKNARRSCCLRCLRYPAPLQWPITASSASFTCLVGPSSHVLNAPLFTLWEFRIVM